MKDLKCIVYLQEQIITPPVGGEKLQRPYCDINDASKFHYAFIYFHEVETDR